ncbi:50S ribosomal protein L25/general stress protein Ctc [Endozoicomonas ascidiicola]|uniref:50S ribosomal protein L25/general stress protein Ctc n=1 Tax=Endozoicomonas ascidiicola TaxID=1698521 RepID=UPI000835B177|nr:50S ribosomal protein L25/general stress protein Ctc [Endozoicomonas ascidiicola]
MSEAIVLSAVARKDVGKGASRRLRRADLVPAIIYGGSSEPLQITLEGKAIRKALEVESFYSQIVTLEVDGAKQQAILKDLQRHPAKEFAMHMDFLRVEADHEVTTNVPLHFINEEACVGVKAGGAIVHNRVDLEIKCLPGDLPEFIEVDMANVELGGHVHLSDIAVPAGVEVLNHGQDLDISSVQATRAGTEEDEASEASSEEAGEE